MDRNESELRLHEQLLLLALRDDKGTVESRAGMYLFALGGAILSELLLEGCISVGEDKKKLVDLAGKKHLYDDVLDEALGLVAGVKRPRGASDWVRKFAYMKRLRHRIAAGLCRKGILRDSEDKILLIFTRKIYPTIDPGPERRLKQRIRRAIMSESRSLDSKIGILVALAHATGMLRIHFDRAELKNRKDRLDRIAKGELVAGATRAAVQAAQAAAMSAVMAASVAATAARH